MRRLLPFVCGLLLAVPTAHAAEIGFVEQYVLAPDRTVPLKQLIPGTEDYYYFHALHYLSTEQFEKVRELLGPWVQRHNRTPRVVEIETRLALLTYDKDPQKTLEYLRQRLNLPFQHQKEIVGAAPNLPTAVDPALLTREAFLQRTFQHNPVLNGLEDSALDWLTAVELPPDRRQNLLQRLQRPDYPQLVKLIADDLSHPNSPGFGGYAIHRQLLVPQLEDLLKLRPDLLNHGHFVMAYLGKLQPGPDEDWRGEAGPRIAYLDRLQSFVERLPPVHNSLKAHVLYHRLASDRAQGKFDRARFDAYLKLPRPLPYVSPKFLEQEDSQRFRADVNADYSAATLLPPVGNDEPLVRAYLAHFLVDAANTKDFEPYVHDVYLKHLFAETKIVNGLGDAEQWASLLPPEQFQALKERVDIDFLPTNKQRYAIDDPVTLDVFVKNCPTLLVKVFEVNTGAFYRQQLREVDTDINLDGLVAGEEKTYQYGEPALRRMLRRFEFPQLKKPGVYVVDFIGNGRSSRALIRKGRLTTLVRTTPVGQRFTILDDQRRPVNDASVWLAGHEYPPAKDGTVFVPFSNEPGRKPIVISRGDFACLDAFDHEAENYSLTAGIYVDRESLLARRKAKLLIRPGMYVNGTPVSIKSLSEVKLSIVSTDLDGVATSMEVPNVELFEDRETTHEILVPARTATLSATLSGKVDSKTQGKKLDLAAGHSVSINEIERTEKIEDLHLVHSGENFVVELLGRTGERKPNRAVQLQFKHRDFQQPFGVSVKTDAAGRVMLGKLPGIATVTATGPEGISHTWPLRHDSYTYPQSLHGRTGDVLQLPYLGRSEKPARDELSLLELRGESFTADRFAALSIVNGMLRIEKLPPGDYDLLIKSVPARVRIRITTGDKQADYVVGALRRLETQPLEPLQIESVVAADAKLTVQLRNASKLSRVHILATRYMPAFDAFRDLSKVRGAEPYVVTPLQIDSAYITGRNIGDEYRYILDRRLAQKFPGNMLERPSLLLNPWAVRSTQTGVVTAEGGAAFGGANAKRDGGADRAAAAATGGEPTSGDFANLDFLAQASVLLANLTVDEKGLVAVPQEVLGAHQHIHVVAIDPISTTVRSLVLEEPKYSTFDLRLSEGLDPKSHFTQQKQISLLRSGDAFVLGDISASRFESYDSVAEVYGLFTTLTNDAKLAEFRFITAWPTLKIEEKRTLYSKHACHELNFFLAKKDPEFFQQVVLPYLAHKKDKTFLDRWLLNEPLNVYVEPWRHAQLNVVERILLAQRLAAERSREARHVSDLFELLPPNVDQFIRLFDTAVRGRSLDVTDPGAVRQLEEAGKKVQMLADMPAPAPAAEPAAPAPPGASGGMGGFGGGGPRGVRPATAAAAKPAAARDMAEKEMADKQKAVEGKLGRSADALRRKSGAVSDEKARTDLYFDATPQEHEQLVRQLYRKLDPTMEYAENNYYHLPFADQHAGLVTVNAFWRDLAAHDPAQPFMSKHFAEASRNFTEMMFALSLLDLPFDAAKHETTYEGRRMQVMAAGPSIVFHEEVKPAKAPAGAATILVGQNFFRHGDRHRTENGEQVEKYVVDEFLTQTVYGCQVVVTNPTSTRQKLTVLTQIPVGAIGVLNAQATKTIHVSLEPYHTQTIEYHFYFPMAGDFTHFPVHVAKNEEVVAATAPFAFHVVETPTKIDALSWEYVSQNGTNDEVLGFLAKHNIEQLNLEKIAFRMKDKAFFESTMRLLAERRVFHATLYSYALLHNAPAVAKEFLQHQDGFVNECGGRLNSVLLSIDPVARRSYEHLEYKPLVNARAHSLGKSRQIVNDRLHQQYHAYLRQLAFERSLSDDDLLAMTYYLLLQDRIEESLATFAKVNVEKVATKMQYDYCAAYLDFYKEDLKAARAIAAKYVDHPVDRWRNTFAAVIAQLNEAEGQANVAVDADDRSQQQTKLAATEPSLEFQVESRELTIQYQNVKSVRVNYYVMDVELLFSRNPFVQQFSGQFSAIRPNVSLEVALPEGQTSLKSPIPESLQNRNVLIEIVGGGQTRSQPYYANSLQIQVVENYGQVRVTHAKTGKPVAKAYVKVYARTSTGEVKFYKDGYTDLRGRFEYASLSTNDLETAARFSILILSGEHGAAVREAAVPAR
ncbi:MAG: hypothetical protein U0939_18905 [Pirellulales bacterium]